MTTQDQSTPTNPWLKVPKEAPFALPEDESYISAFNKANTRGENYEINLNHMPEPRLGPIDAPVAILQLNPSCGDMAPQDRQTINYKNLQNEQTPHLGITQNDPWWTSRLRTLIMDVNEQELVARNICSIEYFPYSSKNFAHSHIRLPSQTYTFSLVRNFIKQGSIIIVTRGIQLWAAAVPEIMKGLGKSVFITNNPQSAYITKNNLPNNSYEKIVAAICAKA